jgi:hypothetical protein
MDCPISAVPALFCYTIAHSVTGVACRATIKVRKPDNQDEKVVALLAS